MNTPLIWNQDVFGAVLAIGLAVVCYVLYYYLTNDPVLFKYVQGKNNVSLVVAQRLLGFFFLGLIPAVVVALVLGRNILDDGLRTINLNTSMAFFAASAIIILPVYAVFAKKEMTQQQFPKFRVAHWDIKLAVVNIASIVLYLLAYEFLFRGILLFECARVFGAWPAIAISTAIYVCVHLPCKMPETLGSIPLGILMGYIAIKTQTIWAPFAMHLLIAVALDFLALYYHPNMRFSAKWSSRDRSALQ